MRSSYIIATVAAMFVSITTSFAQEVSLLSKGIYCNVEAIAGASLNEKAPVAEGGINVAMGYRFNPHFILAAGIGGMTSNVTDRQASMTVPTFIRLHSDFLDMKVSPYAELDLGYNIMLPIGSYKMAGKGQRNTTELDYKWAEAGYSSRGDYVADMKETNPDWDERELLLFESGSNFYLNMADGRNRYGADGLFAKLTLGVSVAAGGHRVNFGLSASIAQYYWGTWITEEGTNKYYRYGYVSNLAGADHTRGEAVIVQGDNQFMSKFRPAFQAKVGFTF